MGVNTLVKDGIIQKCNIPVTTIHIDGVIGEVHYNPGLTRDNKGNTWVSIRSCIHNPERWHGYEHPMHYQNYLHVGKLDEKTLTISNLKLIEPEEEYTGFQWGIEDVRLFWRKDGLHGIGVILPIKDNAVRACQAEILINYENGTYRLLQDYGHPKGALEKNWVPPEEPTEAFDFIYSPTEIVKDGQIFGETNDLFLHNGTPLIEYEEGYLSLMHIVTKVSRERTYITVAAKWNSEGRLTHHSQMFHFNVGWRKSLRETIEFASALLWSKEGEEILAGLGVKDELPGFCRIPINFFQWQPYEDTLYYNWKWAQPPNRQELLN